MINKKLDKVATKSLLTMLKSPDQENWVMAFEILSNSDLSEYHAELYLLYMYGLPNRSDWEGGCNKALILLSSAYDLEKDGTPITTGVVIGQLLKGTKPSASAIEVLIDEYTCGLRKTFEALGFQFSKFNLEIELQK